MQIIRRGVNSSLPACGTSFWSPSHSPAFNGLPSCSKTDPSLILGWEVERWLFSAGAGQTPGTALGFSHDTDL